MISLKHPIHSKSKIHFSNIEQTTIKITPIIQDVIYNSKYNFNKTKKIKQNNKVYNYFISRFCPKKIVNKILKDFYYYTIYRYNYKNIILDIHLLNNKKYIDIYDIWILAMKGLTFAYLTNKKNIHINLYYAPTSYKKRFNLSSTIKELQPININSGFTNFDEDNSYITIFRKEENMKVFIHELIHLLGLDFCFHNQNDINKLVKKDYSVETINDSDKIITIGNANIFEAYTDAMAIIYNCIFNAILTNSSVSKIILDEIDYQKKVVCKILKIFNMKHILQSKNNQNKLIQKTNVLAYYFIKYGLMLQPNTFFIMYPLRIQWTKNKIKKLYIDAKNNLNKIDLSKSCKRISFSLRMTKNNIIINN